MRIGYFINHFPYTNHFKHDEYPERYWCGGAENVAYNLAINMGKKINQIDIFTTDIENKKSIEKYENISIYRYPTNLNVMRRNISFSLLLNSANVHEDIDKADVNILHAHLTNSLNDFAIIKLANKKDIPIIVTYHGDPQKKMGGIIYSTGVSLYYKLILDKILFHADVIISPSEYYIDESEFLGKYRNKIIVIPNGINTDIFDIELSKEECRKRLGLLIDEKIILFVGKLSPYKGPNILISAMNTILKDIQNTKLVFVGEGQMREELEILSKKMNLNNNVIFAGYIEEAQKPLYYKAADVFCLPSIMTSEVFPIVLLEALASGLPIVVSNLDTFRCIIEDGYNGIITRKNDERSVAEAIISLLTNENARIRMGMNARKKIEDYSWEKITKKTEKLYEDLI